MERGIREFGLTYPIVIDSDREIWKAFANRYWPTKYLLDKEGYLRYAHFGEGAYGESERPSGSCCARSIPQPGLPAVDGTDARRRSRGRGLLPQQPQSSIWDIGADASATRAASGKIRSPTTAFPAAFEENFFYANGRWASTAEYFEAAEGGPHSLRLKYEAAGVNLVMAARTLAAREVVILQDGKPLTREKASVTRVSAPAQQAAEESYIAVQQARMYSLVNNHEFGLHVLELRCPRALRPSPSLSPVASIRSQRAAAAGPCRVMKRVVAALIVKDGKFWSASGPGIRPCR